MSASNEQKQVIDAKANRIVVIAGPGSGKTFTLIQRILADISRGCRPGKMFAVTFTQNGAQEIKERLAAAGVTLAFVGTLHALCLRIASTEREGLTLIDEETARALALNTIAEAGRAGKMTYKSFEETRAAFVMGQKVPINDGIVIKQYRKTLLCMNATDYDLLLYDALTILQRDGMDADALYVDEFQDSAPVDALIYEAIKPRLMFVVGDTDQAVFGFRGASMQALLRMAETSLVFRLQDNYRSGPEICDAATRLISNNRQRIIKATHAVNQTPAFVDAVYCPNEPHEITVVCNNIAAELANGMQPHEIAVLTRYNKTREIYVNALEARGVPVASDLADDDGTGMNTVIAALLALQRPREVITAGRWLMLKEGKTERHEMADFLKSLSRRHRDELLPHYFYQPVNSADELARFLAYCEAPAEAGRVVMATYRKLKPDGINGLILALREGYRAAPKRGVTVTTYHGSKGHEYDYVYMPCFDQETTPGSKTGAELEEERRLTFVAMTRARRRLLITVSSTRAPHFGSKLVNCTPSRFINEALPS